MQARHIEAVRGSWSRVINAEDPELLKQQMTTVGMLVFRTLFDGHPDLLALFPFKDADGIVIEAKLAVHAHKVVDALTAVIANLEDGAATVATLESVVRGHMKRSIRPEHYGVVLSTIVTTLKSALPPEQWGDAEDEGWQALATVVLGIVKQEYAAVEDEAVGKGENVHLEQPASYAIAGAVSD